MHRIAALFGRSALVIKEVQVDESAEIQVLIVARRAGLISWFMSLIGLDSTFTLWVYKDRIESMEGSLSGRIKTVVPMSALDTYTSGFTKPIQMFVIAGLLVVSALISCFNGGPGWFVFALLLLATCCFVGYFLRKCLSIGFTTKGTNGILFLFKRSVIEGIDIDENFADIVCEIVKRNYLEQACK